MQQTTSTGATAKAFPLLALFILLTFISCKKSAPAVHGNGCIEQAAYRFDSLLSDEKLEAVEKLFAANNLSATGLSFYSYEDVLPGYDSVPRSIARVNQFINRLPVIYGQRIFHFSNNVYDSALPKPYTSVAPDTTGRRSVSSLQDIFLKHVPDCVMITFNYDPHATGPSAELYRDTCLKASKVYMDKAGVPGSDAQAGEALVLVWRITPVDAEAPLVYVLDDSNKAWGVPWGYH